MKAPHYDHMRRIYSFYTNDELERVVKEIDGLTDEARNALESELRQRGLETQHRSEGPSQTVARLGSDSEKPKASRWNRFWPVITNEEEAKKAAKSGAYVAALIAVLNAVVSLVAIAIKGPVLGMDGWGLVDALLFAVIAWRIFRFSAPWAIVGLLFYFVEICWRWSTFGPPKGGGIVTTGLLVLGLIASVRGTLFLSKLLRTPIPRQHGESTVDLPTEDRVTDLYQA